ncbi:MAG: hypothetical protein A2163_00360 [Actinobacteria bacterium RBG_13_35_12]|nr:MAG: hypothetical protein A2163_00360 [Actinobacteria bacterium RBG_13_35_12]
MDIKPLNRTHISQIVQLESENAPLKPHYSKYTQKDLDFIFSNPDSCGAAGLFDNKKLIGWGAYRTNWRRHKKEKDVYEISSVVIDKDYRRQGLGTKILNYIIDILGKKTKSNRLFLTVSPFNIPALQFYLNLGFIIYDFQKDIYGPGEDRVYLELTKGRK